MEEVKANERNPSRDYRKPLSMRRATQHIKQAMPQVLGTYPLASPQSMAQQQGNSPLSHRKEVKPP
jgi:hypothetical protein